MTEQDFQTKLSEMIQQIGTLPEGSQREHLEKIVTETAERHGRMKKTVADLQDSLDYLRLSIKYLLFDLEATRRENAYLRKLLEKQASGNTEGTEGGEEAEGNGGEEGESEE